MASAFIVGSGPGLGTALGRRFARRGMTVCLMGRSPSHLRAVAGEVDIAGGPGSRTYVTDVTDFDGLQKSLAAAMDECGVPDVLVYNAAVVQLDRLGELSGQALLHTLGVNVVGAEVTAAAVLPRMAERGSGTFLFSSGARRPRPDLLSLSLGKVAARALASILDQEFGPKAIHVASVIIGGAIEQGTAFDPERIGEAYEQLHLEGRREGVNAWIFDGTSTLKEHKPVHE